METPPVRYARRQGRAIAYQTWGSGPLVFLFITEWAGVSDALWEHPLHLRIWRQLGSFGRVIRVDRSGIGSSDPPSSEIGDLDEWAADLLAVLDAEDVATCGVIAEAWGGHAGIALAVNHPERVDRLLLMNSYVARSSLDGVEARNSHEVLDAAVGFVRAKWGTGRVIDTSSGFGHDYLEYSARYERLAASPSVAAAMARAAHTSDVSSLLPSIGCPTLVLYSAAYTYIGERHSERLAAEISGAELVAADTETWYVLGTAATTRLDEFLTGGMNAGWGARELAVVVFSDIVESTTQLARLGDREWTQLLESANDCVVREVHRLGGQPVKQTGDGHLLIFPSPGAAIGAVSAIRRSTKALGLSMRFGVHMGEIERREDGDVAGMTVHTTARIVDVAKSGEIVASRVISDLLTGTGPEFADLGYHELKGLPSALQLFSIHTA